MVKIGLRGSYTVFADYTIFLYSGYTEEQIESIITEKTQFIIFKEKDKQIKKLNTETIKSKYGDFS